jgi:hypothetical protein
VRITQVPRGVTPLLSSVQDLAVPDESKAVLLKTGARTIPSRDFYIGPQSTHQFLTSTLYTAAPFDHRRSTSDSPYPNVLSNSEFQQEQKVGHQVFVTISGACCLCDRTPATEVLFYLDSFSRSSREAGISPPISCSAEDVQIFCSAKVRAKSTDVCSCRPLDRTINALRCFSGDSIVRWCML